MWHDYDAGDKREDTTGGNRRNKMKEGERIHQDVLKGRMTHVRTYLYPG